MHSPIRAQPRYDVDRRRGAQPEVGVIKRVVLIRWDVPEGKAPMVHLQ
jgi:hypothetical protein